MRIGRFLLPHANVRFTLATSRSADRAWDDLHHLLRARGQRTRSRSIDLLLVVADSRDPDWYRLTQPLCRRATLAVVCGIAWPALDVRQFAYGLPLFYNWMSRYFDCVLVDGSTPMQVLRLLLDFLDDGMIGRDFADLMAILSGAGHCSLLSLRFQRGLSEPDLAQQFLAQTGQTPVLCGAKRVLALIRSDPRWLNIEDVTELSALIQLDDEDDSITLAVDSLHGDNADRELDLIVSHVPHILRLGPRSAPTLSALPTRADQDEEDVDFTAAMQGFWSSADRSVLLARWFAAQAVFYDDYHQRIGVLASCTGGLALIASNPALALLLAHWDTVRVCDSDTVFHWSAECAVYSNDKAAVIARCLRLPQRRILGLLRRPASAAMVRVLAKITSEALDIHSILAVCSAMADAETGPDCARVRKLLTHAPCLGFDAVMILGDTSLAICVTARFIAELADPWPAGLIGPWLMLLIVTPVTDDDEATMPRFDSLAALQRECLRHRPNIFGWRITGSLPEPGDGIERLQTADALKEEGKQMGHCIGSDIYCQNLRDSRTAYYRIERPHRATAHFCKRTTRAAKDNDQLSQQWNLVELRGQNNQMLDAKQTEEIMQRLNARPKTNGAA